jgi:hypothetical protein
MSADELGLTDVQKGRLLQIAERARKDAEAVLTPEQRETFATLTVVAANCGCGHVAADTPEATQHAAHGTCMCPHCVAARRAVAASHASQ